MNITEFMSFDLEWFTTLPGLLITGGVIVLLIALIIFIISNKKADKNKEEEVASSDVATSDVSASAELNTPEQVAEVAPIVVPSIDNNMAAMPINTDPAPMGFNPGENGTYTSRGSVNILGELPVEQPTSIPTPVVNTNDNVVVPTVAEPAQPVVNDFNVNNTMPSNNVVDFTAVANTPVEPIQSQVVEVPTVVTPVQEVAQPQVAPVAPVEPVVQQEVQPTIYGGVNPINAVNNATAVNDVKPVIYGGANPLENTTTIPRMTNHEAYNASANIVSEPVQQPAPIEPVQPQVVEAPVVPAPVQETVQPQVVPAAPVEPVAAEPVIQPTMPMTGEAMFGATETSENNASDSSSEIETLEF